MHCRQWSFCSISKLWVALFLSLHVHVSIANGLWLTDEGGDRCAGRQLGKARNVADRQVLYGTLLPMYIVRDIIAMLC